MAGVGSEGRVRHPVWKGHKGMRDRSRPPPQGWGQQRSSPSDSMPCIRLENLARHFSSLGQQNSKCRAGVTHRHPATLPASNRANARLGQGDLMIASAATGSRGHHFSAARVLGTASLRIGLPGSRREGHLHPSDRAHFPLLLSLLPGLAQGLDRRAPGQCSGLRAGRSRF